MHQLHSSQQHFVVTFTDMDGATRERSFMVREAAIRFLNVVILDYGYADGRLVVRGGEWRNGPRVVSK